ncbi:MarR family winged helix-turn-helix transcriptional regulator [Micromonospora sp. NPDC003197]
MTTDPSPGPGQTLFRFVRHWARRADASDISAARGRDVLVTEAVYALSGRGEVSINDVSAELGIDQSGASRMVSDAVGRHLLTVTASTADARRRVVAVTPQGEAMLRDAHRWQEQAFARLTEDWTDTERVDFQRAMQRLVAASADLHNPSSSIPGGVAG